MHSRRSTLFALTILCFQLALHAQVPSYVAPTGLLGWWPLDNSPDDVSTNGNHFSNNGATGTTDRFGAGNAAYQFNGTSSHLVNTAFSHTFSDTGSFSVSMWVKKTSTANGVFMMSGSSAADNFIWLMQGGASSMSFGTNKQQQAWFYTSTPYTVNTWTHLVGTYSGQVMKFYKNGALVGTLNFTYTGTTQANLPLYVGRGPGGNYLNGMLDDIGVWGRALNVSEISALYSGGCGALVSTQPADQQVNLGDLAQFSVVPTSTPATYQWQTDQGLGFQNVMTGGQYFGATTANLTLANATLANDAQAFRCRVTVGSCTDTSDVAVLTVNNNIGTAEHVQEMALATFPNPVSDLLSIKVAPDRVGSHYTLVDPQGRIVRTGTLASENTIVEMGELPRGTYVLTVKDQGGVRLRVVKQ